MIDIAHLLEQADRLGAASDGADQPRSTDLRRAVSAAYYAVFHAGLIAAADLVSGEARRGTTRYCLAYRSIDHAKMKSLCQEIIKHKPSVKYQRYVPDDGWDRPIIRYCEAFVTLNEQRMLADCDPAYRVTPIEVEAYIRTARTAIDDLGAAAEAARHAFPSLLLFPPRRTSRLGVPDGQLGPSDETRQSPGYSDTRIPSAITATIAAPSAGPAIAITRAPGW